MKYFTKNLNYFGIAFLILSLVFRYSLSLVLKLELYQWPWIIAIMYGLSAFLLGWVFGKRDRLSLPLSDIGFRFHSMTYFISNLVALLWFRFGFNALGENIVVIYMTVLCWGFGLLIHFYFYWKSRKHTVKGISKTELFE